MEEKSGIEFFHKSGYMTIMTKPEAEESLETHRDMGINCQLLTEHPFMKWPEECVAIEERKESGHINPRKLVEAQQKLAGENCHIVDGIVTDVTEENKLFKLKIKSSNGEIVEFTAKKIVLAMGSYTNFSSEFWKVLFDK